MPPWWRWMPSLQALQTPRLESRTPSEKSARLQVAADDEPIAAAGRHEPPGCRTQLQTAPAASPRWTATRLCRSASPSSLSRSAGLRKMSSVLLPNRSILEASKVSGCDGGLHSRPELSALVSRVGGELAQVMRRRRARTCSMRSAGCRLVPSDGGGATRNSRALAFHAGGPRQSHAHVSGPWAVRLGRSRLLDQPRASCPRRPDECWVRWELETGGNPLFTETAELVM